jgi:hypothetical protein
MVLGMAANLWNRWRSIPCYGLNPLCSPVSNQPVPVQLLKRGRQVWRQHSYRARLPSRGKSQRRPNTGQRDSLNLLQRPAGVDRGKGGQAAVITPAVLPLPRPAPAFCP